MNLHILMSRTDEVGDCLIWNGTTGATGYPVVSFAGRVHYVRRLVFSLCGGALKPQQPVVAKCDDRRCINPAHLHSSTRKKVAQAAGKKGLMGGQARGALVSAGRRKKSKLTEAHVAEIRSSTESGRALGRRYSITAGHANNIKRGTARRDYSSPFAGLMRRAA